jgi:hypothetical protein
VKRIAPELGVDPKTVKRRLKPGHAARRSSAGVYLHDCHNFTDVFERFPPFIEDVHNTRIALCAGWRTKRNL